MSSALFIFFPLPFPHPNDPTPESIALFLEQELIKAGVWERSEEPPPPENIAPLGTSADEIARLSDEQVEQMIMERLKKKKEEADI